MAKKVVAKSRSKDTKNFAKVIRAIRSPKTKAYTFKEDSVPAEEVKNVFSAPKKD